MGNGTVKQLDTYQANISFLNPLKTENQRFSDVFIGYRNRVLNKFNLFLANVPILYPLKTPENLWYKMGIRGIKWEH